MKTWDRRTRHTVTEEPETDYSQGMMSREAAMKEAAKVTPNVYPGADFVYVHDYTVCEYRPDGTGVTWSDSYTKVLTRKGRRERQCLCFPYTHPYANVATILLEIIRSDGRIRQIEVAAQSWTTRTDAHLLQGIFSSGSRVLRIRVPGVKIGDLVHVVTRREILKPLIPNAWGDCQVFESVAPIRHATYEVHAPQEASLRSTALKDVIKDTVIRNTNEYEGGTVYRWEVSSVPSLRRKRQTLDSFAAIQRLLVSTLSDWETVSRWYWQLCQPHIDATTPALRAMVEELTKERTSREEKIETLFYWVSRQVRFMAVATDNRTPGWEPRDVAATFSDRRGVCRDKAALLVAMLRLAGLDAYPVLVGVSGREDVEVPLLCFDHTIAAVDDGHGSYRLLDCADEAAAYVLHTYLRNRSYLIAHPNGDTLRTSSAMRARENSGSVEGLACHSVGASPSR